MDTTISTTVGSSVGSISGLQTNSPVGLTGPVTPAGEISGIAQEMVSPVTEPQDYYDNQNPDKAFPSLDVLMQRILVIVRTAIAKAQKEAADKAVENRQAAQKKVVKELDDEVVQKEVGGRKAAELQGHKAPVKQQPPPDIVGDGDLGRTGKAGVPGTAKKDATGGKSESPAGQPEAVPSQPAPLYPAGVKQQETDTPNPVSGTPSVAATEQQTATTPSSATADSAVVGPTLPVTEGVQTA
ncbi:MAG: hypothetical protein ABSE73_03570 [Planctomycetota bacterium]